MITQLNILTPDITKIWTYQDIQDFDEDFYCEIINGELYMSPSPSKAHQRQLFKIAKFFDSFVESRDLGEIFLSPLDVKLDEQNIVQPDLIYISKNNINFNSKEKIIIGPPDLVLEIVSPYSVRRDYYSKLKMYEQFKIAEYWIVDPANEVVEIFSLNDKMEYELSAYSVKEGECNSTLLQGFTFSLKHIFS